MSSMMVVRDLFFGQTNSSGKTRISCVRVWDAERFLDARRQEGANAKEPADRFTVSVHTEQEFKEQA